MTRIDGPSADAPVRIRISSPTEMATAIAYHLGFEPEDSVVLASLDGPRKRLGFTLRLDLPPEEHHAAAVQQLVGALQRNSARRVLMFVYEGSGQPRRRDGSQPYDRLVDQLGVALREAAIDVEDAWRVGAGRCWSYTCRQQRCCPDSGILMPGRDAPGPHQRVAAAMAMHGATVVGSRREKAALLAPLGSRAAAAMLRALDEAAQEIGAVAADAARAETLRLAREARALYADGRSSLIDADAARLIVGLEDKRARDEICTWALDGGEEGDVLQAMFVDLTRRAVPPHGAAVATVLGCVAYHRGDGMLARTALDRALAVDPGYTFARQLSTMLDHALPPSLLSDVMRSTAAELGGRPGRAGRPRRRAG